METLNAMQLAGHADCYSPDSDQSPGAGFLGVVADSVREAWEYLNADERKDCDTNDRIAEAVDGCLPIYTGHLWRVFTDLGAWAEDPTDLGFEGEDMEQGARLCLYMIAERLGFVLWEEWTEETEENESNEED